MENNEFKKYFDDLYDRVVPLVFTDGTYVYNELKKEYVMHDKGYFIYGPSGCGKTYFFNNQKIKNWIDGDILWSTYPALKVQGLCLPLKAGIATKSHYLVILKVFSTSSV